MRDRPARPISNFTHRRSYADLRRWYVDTLIAIAEKAVSRRKFLAGAGSLGATAIVAGCSDNGIVNVPTPASPSTTYTDADILNFALNLEYLEAEFYLRAATGSGLASADTTGVGSLGTVTVGQRREGPRPHHGSAEHPERDRLRRTGSRPLPPLRAQHRRSCSPLSRSQLLRPPRHRSQHHWRRHIQSVRELRRLSRRCVHL